MYIIIKLLSYYYYFIIIFFPHERRGLHDPILVLINSISSSLSYIYICFLCSILDSNLTYSFHIINVCDKLSKIVYHFRKLTFLNIHNLILLYDSFVYQI